MGIYRVSCEVYDKAWYLRTSDKVKAVNLVEQMTVERGWHLDFPNEPRNWNVEEVFTKEGEIFEDTDL